MQPIVNKGSKESRRCLKAGSAEVTKLRTVATLLVVIGMPFSVEAFIAASQSHNDTHAIINEDYATPTQFPQRTSRTFVRLLRNQETIVKKLDSLAREISLIKGSLGLRSFRSGYEFETRDMLHHKPFDDDTAGRQGNKVEHPLDEINEKLTALLYLQSEQILQKDGNHKPLNTPVPKTFERNKPRSRKRRSSSNIPNTFAFSTPVFNTHIPSINLEAGYFESNHINTNQHIPHSGENGHQLTGVQPSVNTGGSFTPGSADNPAINSVYDDPQPMYGPLYDRNPVLYKTSYIDAYSPPGTSYQAPALRYDSLLDGQQTPTNFGPGPRDSSYYSSPMDQSSTSETEETDRHAAYIESHSDETSRLTHGMKSMLQELLSLVRWLVRKKHQSQTSQNGYVTSIQHSLNQRITSIEGTIIEAITTQTQDILQSAHQIGHEIRLETTNFNSKNLSQFILEAVSNATSEWETTFFKKCSPNSGYEIGTPNGVENILYDVTEHSTEASHAKRTAYDIQAATIEADNNKNAYYLPVNHQESTETDHHHGNNHIPSNRNKMAPFWEVFSLSDFLSDSSDDSNSVSEPKVRIHQLEASEMDVNSTVHSLTEVPKPAHDSPNATDEDRLRISLESLSPRSATQAARVLVLATELLKNASSSHHTSSSSNTGQPQESRPCVAVNQTELVRSFTDEFQAFLDEIKTKLGYSLSQNLAEDSLELVLSRLLAPSLQRLEERMVGVQIYLDAAVLKLRHEFEAAIATSEASLNASLAASVGAIVREAVDGAMAESRETALQIADATVTSISSAAVASGHYSNEVLTGAIKRATTQVKNAIKQGVGGCPQHFTSLGGLCLKVPTITPPVPFAPTHYSPTLTPTPDAPQTTSYNWTQARAICRSYEGDLAVVPEFQDLKTIFRSLSTDSGQGFWLGAKRKRATEDDGFDQPEPRVKLKWITGEFSELSSELKLKTSPFIATSQRNDINYNSAEDFNGTRHPENQECLVLRADHSLVLEVADCGALHKPLCQFIPTL